MDLFTPLLLSACIGTVGVYNDACKKSVEAAYIQTGIAADANHLQSGAMAFGKEKKRSILGKSEWIINTTFAAAAIAKSKKARFTLPNMGMCDKLSTELQPKNYGLKMEWRW